MKHLFILNPAAGGLKRKLADIIRTITDAMTMECNDFDIYVTSGPMDACSHVKEAASKYSELRVYACGGDGTLNECVNGAVGFDNVAVTHYPCGTGNDFVKMFGKHDAALFQDLIALSRGEVRKLDLIKCGDRYGINICSVGIDARIGTDVHKYSRFPLMGGAGGYIVSLAVNLAKGINQRLIVKTDGYFRLGEYSLVCACNGRYYGGGFNPVPDALPNDGKLDFLVVKSVSGPKFIQLVGKYAKGKYRDMTDKISYFRGDCLEIHSEEDIVVNVDGEAVFAKDIEFKVVPQGINFIFPEGVDFFG